MRSLPIFVALLALLATPVVFGQKAVPDPATTAGVEKWEKEISAFEAADREAPPAKGGIVFVGSSSIKKWKTLAEDFPHHRVLNRGFGGSQLSDSVHFADRIIIPYAPRMVVVYAGGNDINAGKTADDVFSAFQALVAKVQAALPDVEIAYISIAGNPKRWSQVETVKEANAKIAAFIKDKPRLTFINVFPKMMGPDGLPLPDIFVADQLHMNEAGYRIWRDVVGPYLGKSDR